MSYTLKNKLLHDQSNNIYKYINSYIDHHKKEKDIKRQSIIGSLKSLYCFCRARGRRYSLNFEAWWYWRHRVMVAGGAPWLRYEINYRNPY